MAEVMEEFTIRFANDKDYTAIVRMSKGIYDGHDYIQYRFHQWISDKNYVVCVAVAGENIIGLSVGNIADNNKTLVHESTRVDQRYRDKGIAGRLLASVNEYVRNKYPLVVRLRGVTSTEDLPSKNMMQKMCNLLLEKSILPYVIDEDSNNIETLDNSIKHSLSKCTKAHVVKQILHNNSERLLGNNIHIIDWVPYEITANNTDQMFNDNDSFFISLGMERENDDMDQNGGDDGVPKNGDSYGFINSFSQGRASNRVMPHWATTIYAKDPIMFRAHLLHQLKEAFLAIKRKFLFEVSCDVTMMEYGTQVLGEELQLTRRDNYFQGMVLYEGEFPR